MLLRNEFRRVASLRWTQFLDYQAWRLSVFAARARPTSTRSSGLRSPTKATDRWSLTLGANLFEEAREATFFGRLDRSDLVYLRGRYDFSLSDGPGPTTPPRAEGGATSRRGRSLSGQGRGRRGPPLRPSS